MSSSTERTLENKGGVGMDHRDRSQQKEPSQGWEIMARAWVSAFPEAKAVCASEVEAWIDSNFDSLPAELRDMPRSEIIDKLLSIQHYMRPAANQGEQKVAIAPPDQHPARFQRTDQWIPVYAWLESLDREELVKSKDITDWLTANPEIREQLCSRHSKYHLTHYIKKCHVKILKRKEKKGLIHPKNETVLEHKDSASKQLVTFSGDPLSNIPRDSELYELKHKEALRKFEILVELEKKLSPIFSKPQLVKK